MSGSRCRFCQAELKETFVDLGRTPLSNAYLTAEQIGRKEPFYPLYAWVCTECLLVQLEAFETPEQIFGDYAYFSSYSDSWLAHCRNYVEQIVPRLGLGADSNVVELASNDGYLLQYFQNKGIPVRGIEPARNVAQAAIDKGIPTEIVFFGVEAAQKLRRASLRADLLIGNNVLAHVPDLNDFVAGMKILLADGGIITMEFPHLLKLIEQHQFDTIYHEHFSYFSFSTAQRVFAHHGLRLYNVQELPTHGGSLRIYACHEQADIPTQSSVSALKHIEKDFGLLDIEIYRRFPKAVERIREQLVTFLKEQKAAGKQVLGYGAPAKGNTLLNYCRVDSSLLEFTVDRSIHKQNRFLPGSHIPVHAPEAIFKHKPDYVLILPWNIKDEIMEKMADIRKWGGRFVVPIPQLEVLP